jgi:sialate O-acetylesterase
MLRKSLWTAFALASFALCSPSQARADVKPHPLITENMVLQQGVKVPLWGDADDGEKVTVSCQGQTVSATAQNGKWQVCLENLKAGGPYPLTIAGKNTITYKNVLVGEVWIASGQSNMEWPLRASDGAEKHIGASANPLIRLFTVPHTTAQTPQTTVNSKWVECGPTTVPSFSAVAYFFGRELQKSRGVPVGLIHTSWGGTPAEAWTSQAALEAQPSLKHYLAAREQALANYPQAMEKYKADLEKHKAAVEKAKAEGKTPPPAPRQPAPPDKSPHIPSSLYNGMIAPLIPYAIKGAIWYQGESNAGRAYEYRTLFPAMIKNWRDDWKQGDFPFLLVQLAPFMQISKTPQESAWAELREAQLLATKACPNTGMAVITDVGDERDIHPKWKDPVGARLALAARAIGYGEKIEFSGPLYDSVKFEGNKAILSFTHTTGGLVAKGTELTGFTITGEDKKFVNAKAEIQDQHVVVWSDEVTKPVAVRFGWANYPVVNLWNKEGLPATPFRTDDFPLTTAPKK